MNGWDFVLSRSFKFSFLLVIKELFFYREKGRMEIIHYKHMGKASYKNVLDTDIQHANAMAAAIPKANGGARLQMKLVYNHFTPLFLFFLKWIDCSCTYFLPTFFNPFHILIYKVYTDGRPTRTTSGRKASIKDFYDVILPSLEQLHDSFVGLSDDNNENLACRNFDSEREDDECGICLGSCTKMVIPNCCHAMCISCFREWSIRSETCPFCRCSLRRVKSRDLWVLTGKDDVIDPDTVSIEDLRRFYLLIKNLPKDTPDALFLIYYEYLI